jgi:hypothetical protein
MAETAGLSRNIQHRRGVIGGVLAVLRLGRFRLVPGQHAKRLRAEEWPDYLLRDVGLDRAELDPHVRTSDRRWK